MDIKPCVIEFQAFRDNKDEFVIKELVILDLITHVVYPFIFEAPFSANQLNDKARRTNKWITKHFHHIQWNEGLISYKHLNNIMYHFSNKFSHIYTRGSEKRQWIQQYTYHDVFDIRMDKDQQINYGPICTLTDHSYRTVTQCALQNAYRLANFLVLHYWDKNKFKQQQWKYYEGNSSGGGNVCYKYSGQSQDPHQYYSRHRRGNISQGSPNQENGFTTVSPVFGGSVQHPVQIQHSKY